MDPALEELYAEGAPDDEVAVVLRLTDSVVVPDAVRIVARFGDIATCRVRRDDLLRVHALQTVRSVKAPRLYGPGDGVVESLDDAPTTWPSDERRPAELEDHTGRGVLLAHIDWGADFVHPAFRHPDGRTRFAAIWDQAAPYDAAHPNRYGYGRIYRAADIDLALQQPDPYAALGYDAARANPRGASHGSHTLGISGGNGRCGGPAGLAPEAIVAFVDLSTAQDEGTTGLGDSAAFLEALDFLGGLARELGAEAARVRGSGGVETGASTDLPLVVNASLGRQCGQHDGKTLTERGMDAFVMAQPGRAICQSAGNYFDRSIHTEGLLRPGGTRALTMDVGAAPNTPHEVDLWYPGSDRFACTVQGPGMEPVPIVPGRRTRLSLAGREVGRAYHRLGDPNNGDNQVTVFLDAMAPDGLWTLSLQGLDVVDGRFHAWIERGRGGRAGQARFAPDDQVPSTTTGTIANGLRTISVGAYDAHRPGRALAPFSSGGPTRDGRAKPDCVAPGFRVLSARSHALDTPAPDPLLVRMSGTSMAAPHVAGTVALMFGAAGRLLAIDETRRLLLSTTRPVWSADALERARLGCGRLDPVAAVRAAANAAMNVGMSADVATPLLPEALRPGMPSTESTSRSDAMSTTLPAATASAASSAAPSTVPAAAGVEPPRDLSQDPLAGLLPPDLLAVLPAAPVLATGAQPVPHPVPRPAPQHAARCRCMCPDCRATRRQRRLAEALEALQAIDEMETAEDDEAQDPAELAEWSEAEADAETDAEATTSGEASSEKPRPAALRDRFAARSRRRERAGLPFQLQIPIGGGSPALAMPIGGRSSPLAFSVPLGGPPPASTTAPAATAAPPTPEPAVAAPTVAAVPPVAAPAVEPEPAALTLAPLVVAGDDPFYVPAQAEAEPEAHGSCRRCSGVIEAEIEAELPEAFEAFETLGSSEAWERDEPSLLEAADALVEDDDRDGTAARARTRDTVRDNAPPRSASAWLQQLLAQMPARLASAEQALAEASLSPFGMGGPMPSATSLFNAFVYPDGRALRSRTLASHYGGRFEVLARPGDMVADLRPREGDLLIRVALGQGWSHVAVIASPDTCRHDELARRRWTGEGHPRPPQGVYVHVVERLPRPRRAAAGHARRIADAHCRLLPDTLLLRPARLPGRRDDVERWDEQVPAGPDSPAADRFIAAHASRWCTPGQAGSATCRGIATPRPIRRVVIHALGVPSTARRSGVEAVVAGWQNSGRTASSHYLVDRDGTITQMVRDANVAFHTPGNNADSIGIEHADICNDPAPFTVRLYERSAQLVRELATRHGFSADATTVRGHSQVNPNHGDPGPFWDWEYYYLLLSWDGTTAASRPRRFVASAGAAGAAPAGWQAQRRRAIADDHCASARDPWGRTWWRAQRCGATPAAAEVSLIIDEAGTYQVSLWWPRQEGANRATQLEIEVACLASPCVGASTQQASVDQRTRHGRWNDVAAITVVRAPSELKVRWRCPAGHDGWVIADGVRALKIATPVTTSAPLSMPNSPGSTADRAADHVDEGDEEQVPTPAQVSAASGSACAYFFKGSDYVRYDIQGDAVNYGPVPVGRHWRLPADFQSDIDAALNWGNGHAYLFKGARYVRYNIALDTVDVGPVDISTHWTTLPAAWQRDLDAAVNWGNGTAYFFKDDQVLEMEIATEAVRPARQIAAQWPGLPSAFHRRVRAVVNWGNGKAYFFKDDHYVRVDMTTHQVDVGRTPIAREWTSLPGAFQRDLQAGINWTSPCNLAGLFRAGGLTVIEEPGWLTASSPDAGGRPLAPIGIIIHHTGGNGAADLRTVIRGRTGTHPLRGPLANFYVGRDASIHMISANVANHAGRGAQTVLDEVRRSAAPSGTAASRRLRDGPSGGTFFYGFECENLGTGQTWPAAQLDAMARAAAALCQRHCWNQNRVISHAEWTHRKSDPQGIDMNEFRARVALLF